MSQEDRGENQERRHFFISYTGSDRQWAEWIAMQLELAGYTLFIQAWDFRPGSNLVLEMDKAIKQAERTLLVLSSAYLQAGVAQAQWATAFYDDPTSVYYRLLPVRVKPCVVDGLLRQIASIDLIDLDESQASAQLLAGVQKGRVKPERVTFPGQNIPHVAFPGALPVIWNIPYPRNPVFTGREHLLTRLADTLQPGAAVALAQPQAISGLGGIGKTQLAVEYAYQHRQDYQVVLWARADTAEALIAGYGEMAQLLDLPQKDEQDQGLVVKAVQEWLKRQTGWLLILDNADDLALVRPFLPPASSGHLLLTTRAQTMGRLAQRIEVETLDPEIGALLLLRRADLIPTHASLDAALPSDVALARALTQELGGLPLALDQAGAYIEETQCGLAEYQRQYQTRRAKLLALRGGLVEDHPESVATTWSLSFQKVAQASPIAAEVLRICAFLAPDAIPEELLVEALKTPLTVSEASASEDEEGVGFSPIISGHFDEAVALLRAYSLVQRYPQEQVLSVHRLVQVVLREAMGEEERRAWTQHVVRVVRKMLPRSAFANWKQCEQYVPHAQACVFFVGGMHGAEEARVWHWLGAYLLERQRTQEAGPYVQQALTWREQHLGNAHLETATSLDGVARWWELQGKYAEAEPLYERALAIRERQLGAEHLDTSSSLNNLAALYDSQGKYAKAEPLLVRALAIREEQLGAEHPDTAGSLNNLALLYANQGKYAEAEPLLVRALAIYERTLGAEHPDTALSVNNLAELYEGQGKYAKAEPLLVRALAICEQQLGAEHPDTASGLNNLALLYNSQGKHAKAEPLLVRALAIYEQTLGAEHPDTACSLNNLATLYASQGKHAKAEPLLVRALAIYERILGAEHLDTVSSLNNLALLYNHQSKYAKAESLLMRALAICERTLGAEHLNTSRSLTNLALLYDSQGKYTEAEPLLVRALAIVERTLGAEHPDTALNVNNLAELYKSQGKYAKAEPLLVRALAICEQQLGAKHPDTASGLNNLALLYNSQGKYAEAEPLYERALTICEQQLGAEHPNTALSLNNLATLYDSQGKYAEAEPLYERALAICEQQLGAEHPDTACGLNNLATLYASQRKYAEAEPLYERALAICEQQLGAEHPHTQGVRKGYTLLLEAMKQDDTPSS